jgi:hypothetical protein
VSTIHLHATTTSTPEQFLAALIDFGPAFESTAKAIEARNSDAVEGSVHIRARQAL